MPSWRDLDHYFYRKSDADGNLKHTKISKGTGEIHGSLWNEILKKQLQVTKNYFNSKL